MAFWTSPPNTHNTPGTQASSHTTAALPQAIPKNPHPCCGKLSSQQRTLTELRTGLPPDQGSIAEQMRGSHLFFHQSLDPDKLHLRIWGPDANPRACSCQAIQMQKGLAVLVNRQLPSRQASASAAPQQLYHESL